MARLIRFSITVFTMFISMVALSYFWHGVFLNDFNRISYPKELFFMLYFVLYAAISLLLAIMTIRLDLDNELIKRKHIRGLIFGGALGFLVYLIAFVLGVSFAPTNKLEHIVLDFVWQMIECGIGGFVGGGVYSVVFRIQHAIRTERSLHV